jgi:hypothetical protein
MSFGYHGKILHVDLTAGKLEVEEPSETSPEAYPGRGRPTGTGEHPQSDGGCRHRRALLRPVSRHGHR